MATTTLTSSSSTTATSLPLPLSPQIHMNTPTSPSRVVRFDTECILIPQPVPASSSKLPLVLTKSYSLPLWRKTPAKSAVVLNEDEEEGPEEIRAKEVRVVREERVVIKVPIPLFRRRTSRSPGPTMRSLSTSPIVPRAPLPSCLVHQHPTSSTSASPTGATQQPLRPLRRVSLPPPPSSSSSPHDSHPNANYPPHSPSPAHSSHNSPSPNTWNNYATPLQTIPLRPCCAACEAATEHALAEGERWKVHFTRGAKRRRSASLEQPYVGGVGFSSMTTGMGATAVAFASLSSSTSSAPPPSSFATRGFAGLAAPLDDDDVNGNVDVDIDPHSGLHIVHNASAATATKFALRVDEVDKRRSSAGSSISMAMLASASAPGMGVGSSSSTPPMKGFGFSNEEEHYARLREEYAHGFDHDRRSTTGSPANSNSSSASGSGSGSPSPTRDSGDVLHLESGRSVVYGGKHDFLSPSPEAYGYPSSSTRLRASPIVEEEEGGSRSASARSSVSNLGVGVERQGDRNGSNTSVGSKLSRLSVASVASNGSRRSSASSLSPGGKRRSSRRISSTPNVACKPDVGDVEGDLFPLPGGSPGRSPSPRAALGSSESGKGMAESGGGKDASGMAEGGEELLEAVLPLGRRPGAAASNAQQQQQQQLGRGALSVDTSNTNAATNTLASASASAASASTVASASGLGRKSSAGSGGMVSVSPRGPRAQTPVGRPGSAHASNANGSNTNASSVAVASNTNAANAASTSTSAATNIDSSSSPATQTQVDMASVSANHGHAHAHAHAHFPHVQLPHLHLHQLHAQHNSASSGSSGSGSYKSAEGSDAAPALAPGTAPVPATAQVLSSPPHQSPVQPLHLREPQSPRSPPQSPRSPPQSPRAPPQSPTPQSPRTRSSSASQSQSQSQSTRSSSASQSPTRQRRKHSFTAPFVKAGGVLRDAGADVLRGVSGLGMAGGVGGA